jgi:transcriptional regulator with XRE-family HTH domain
METARLRRRKHPGAIYTTLAFRLAGAETFTYVLAVGACHDGVVGEDVRFGWRVHRQRLRLGVTQAELGRRVGHSQGWVSKVERGDLTPDRVGLINELARALHCHPNDLIGRPYAATPAQNQWYGAAQEIIRQLRRYDLPPTFVGTPRRVEALRGELDAIHGMRDAAGYRDIMMALPGLLEETSARIAVASGHEREEAFVLYGIACKAAHTAAYGLGHPELIALAANAISWAADNSADPMMPAIAMHIRARDMWATNSNTDALALLDRGLATIEDEWTAGDIHALRTWGSLQLRAAVSASRMNNRAEAEDRIVLAQEAADRLANLPAPHERDRHELTFSPGNVLTHAVNIAIEMGDAPRALALNDTALRRQRTALATLPPSRIGHHHLDLARAWLWQSRRDRALHELETAEKIAPQLIRSHPIAHAVCARLIEAERAGTQERIRRIANRFGLGR